jgi:hypothetical protein
MKKIIYLLSVTFLLLQSCSSGSDSNNPAIQGKLKKITSSNYNINYNYDANNLIGYDESIGNNITAKHTFTRDSNNKIVSYTFNSIQSNTQITTNYTRDSNGKILSSITKYVGATNPNETRTYSYTGSLISQISASDGSKNRFSYDNSGNLIKMENLAVNSNQWITFATMIYDSKINPLPYEDINPMYSIFTCHNNIISNIYANGLQYTTSYVYNSQNMPVSAISQGVQVNYFYN